VSVEDDVADWLERRSERVIQTSCAHVYLQADRALKVKRAVDLGFLDFSTPDKRKWALDRELAFNRRTAPDIYRAVHAITQEPGGAFAFDGDGAAVEWALELRRFDDDAVLSNHPHLVDGALAETLGRTVARAHIGAPATPDGGGVAALGYTVSTNAEHLRALSDTLGADQVERVIAGTNAVLAAQSPLLEARRLGGFARHCHGDLHLGNIVLEHGAPILFDCIEFNDRLSEIDTLYDLAFLIMDLDFRHRGAAANRVLNAYLDEAARGLPIGLWDGLAAFPLMLSARASVRAHVSAATGEATAARDYLAAAERHLRPPKARLFAVGGLSGSGKTTFARELAPLIAGAPGAVILRSDEIRKRLWSVASLAPLPSEAYAPATNACVYAEMLKTASTLLGAGRPVVLDAAFLAPAERDGAAELARRAGVPFQGIWLTGDPTTLRARLASRSADASDADARVLETQLARAIGPVTWRPIPAEADFAAEAPALAA